MNDEYINREAVLKAFKLVAKNPNKDYQRGMQDTIDCLVPEVIADIPSADVQPVKRGRWIETHISLCKWIPEDEKEEGHSFYMAELKCSCCERYNTVTFALSLTKPDFCQLCGAKMDKTRNLTDEETDIYNSQLEAESETIEKVSLF